MLHLIGEEQMTELRIQKVKAVRAGARPETVSMKTVVLETGKEFKVFSANSASPNLGGDLLYAFKMSVEKARKTQKNRRDSLHGN